MGGQSRDNEALSISIIPAPSCFPEPSTIKSEHLGRHHLPSPPLLVKTARLALPLKPGQRKPGEAADVVPVVKPLVPAGYGHSDRERTTVASRLEQRWR